MSARPSRARFASASRITSFAIAALLVCPLLIIDNSGAAVAADDGMVGVRPFDEPNFFHLSVKPGESTIKSVVVSNHTDTASTLSVYAVDGSMSSQGTFMLAAESDPRLGVGDWTALRTTQISVAAHSEVRVPFRVSVPLGTPPGDYVGGVIVQSAPVQGNVSQSGSGTAVRMDVVHRSGVRIYLNVAGTARTKLTAGVIDWHQDGNVITVSLPLHNSGNVTMHPKGALAISSMIGVNTTTAFVVPESILPGQSFTLLARFSAPSPVEIGTGTAVVSSEAGMLRAQTSIVSISWLLIGALVLALLLILFLLWRVTRFLRKAHSAIAEVSASRSALLAPEQQDAVSPPLRIESADGSNEGADQVTPER